MEEEGIIKGVRVVIGEYKEWGEEEIYKGKREEGEKEGRGKEEEKKGGKKREERGMDSIGEVEEEGKEGRIDCEGIGERIERTLREEMEEERKEKEERERRDGELKVLREEVERCKKCELGKWRVKSVFGEGSEGARIMFVGEGPGYEEDHKGEPFIGRAGELLTKIIEAMGERREDVYITNIVKCHAMKEEGEVEKRSNDRAPREEEMEECRGYLDKQIGIIRPMIIVLLGGCATKGLLRIEEGISRIRGEMKEYRGIKVMPTYHPAALLRNERLKREVWEDMKRVKRYINTREI